LPLVQSDLKKKKRGKKRDDKVVMGAEGASGKGFFDPLKTKVTFTENIRLG